MRRGSRNCESKMFSVGQFPDQVKIGGQKVVAGKGTEGGPAHFIEDTVFEFTLEFAHKEELQVDRRSIAIAMTEAGYMTTDRGVNAEFFVQLAGKGDFRRLSGLNLATGKLPFQTHGLVWPTLADQHLSSAGSLSTKDQRGHNVADRGCSEAVCMPLQLANRLFHSSSSIRRGSKEKGRTETGETFRDS